MLLVQEMNNGNRESISLQLACLRAGLKNKNGSRQI
jgi:hypothetical protein